MSSSWLSTTWHPLLKPITIPLLHLTSTSSHNAQFRCVPITIETHACERCADHVQLLFGFACGTLLQALSSPLPLLPPHYLLSSLGTSVPKGIRISRGVCSIPHSVSYWIEARHVRCAFFWSHMLHNHLQHLRRRRYFMFPEMPFLPCGGRHVPWT